MVLQEIDDGIREITPHYLTDEAERWNTAWADD